MFERALRKLNFSSLISRLSLLFLVLTPSVALLPGAINYDNVVFFFAGLLFLNVAKILRSKIVNPNTAIQFLAICMFGILIKYTFVAIAVPAALFILVHVIRSKKAFRPSLNLRNVDKYLLSVFLVGLVLFIERPVTNLVSYGRFAPRCASIIGDERCSKNYTQKRNIDALQNKDGSFQPKSVYQYTFVDWVPNMIRSQVRLQPTDAPNKSILLLYYVGLFGGLSLIAYWLHRLKRSKATLFAMWSVLSLSLALLFTNYLSYKRLGIVVATSSRYLLPAEPFFIALVLSAFAMTFRKHKLLLLPLVALLLFAFISAGGVLTYLHSTSEIARW